MECQITKNCEESSRCLCTDHYSKLIGWGDSARLQDRLVREQKILTSISISYEPYQHGDSLFLISALPQQGVSLTQAQQAIQSEMDKFKTTLVDKDELNAVKANFVANLLYSQDDINT